MDEVKLKVTDIKMQSKEEIKQKLIAWDNKQWKHTIESKSSLLIYRQYKDKIQEENIYDNRPSSTIFYKARNTLPLNDRNRHKTKKLTVWLVETWTRKKIYTISYCTALHT